MSGRARAIGRDELRVATSPEWTGVVLADFDAFLIDHASCERKASATAMSLISHYPDRGELVDTMIDLAREELDHFRQVVSLLRARGLVLGPDRRDEYVNRLRTLIRRGPERYFLDRLLVGGVVEARGCERFGLIADGLEDEGLRRFYRRLSRAEARHGGLFLRIAKIYFDPARVDVRLDQLLDAEAKILPQLPIRPVLH